MKSKPVAFLMSDLGITKTHSRTHTSDDNPYSEAQFKTLKYRAYFPERFGSIEDARSFCQTFFPWYNQEHKHTGISLLTPDVVHYGRADEVIRSRQNVMTAAFAAHPERFVRKMPLHKPLPEAAWITPQSRRRAKFATLNHVVSINFQWFSFCLPRNKLIMAEEHTIYIF